MSHHSNHRARGTVVVPRQKLNRKMLRILSDVNTCRLELERIPKRERFREHDVLIREFLLLSDTAIGLLEDVNDCLPKEDR
jgi:hypothetical protein